MVDSKQRLHMDDAEHGTDSAERTTAARAEQRQWMVQSGSTQPTGGVVEE
jgi:hypothetical protein